MCNPGRIAQLQVGRVNGHSRLTLDITLGEGGELLLFSVIILLGVALTNIMSDGAAAAVLVPITLAVGVAADLDLAMVAILTAISTAFAFATAFGTPPNLIVHASGIPGSADFVRNGVPMVLLAVLVLLAAQRYYWPLATGWLGL